MMQVMVVGATGLVGSLVLSQLLVEETVERVVAPTRRPLATAHAKLINPVVDFEALPRDAEWWKVDSVVCTLGTTMKQAGSRDAFARVDHDYPLQVAQQALGRGALSYALTSAAGADPGSRFFYNRVKGNLERDLTALGYVSLTLVRPGLIDGERHAPRLVERAAGMTLRMLGPLLPARLRINPAERIATALVDAALQARPGRHVVSSERLAA